jgi:hypothetical protein
MAEDRCVLCTNDERAHTSCGNTNIAASSYCTNKSYISKLGDLTIILNPGATTNTCQMVGLPILLWNRCATLEFGTVIHDYVIQPPIPTFSWVFQLFLHNASTMPILYACEYCIACVKN